MITKGRIRLNIGEIYAAREQVVLQTLLGSCVSACLYDPAVGVGGMNHILLPGDVNLHAFDASSRYGINAMELLINEMCQLGARRSRLQAKIFGGGNVLGTVQAKNGPGERNVAFIRDYLELEGIPLIAEDTGGPWTRILLFRVSDFTVFVKRVKARSAQEEEVRKTERKFRQRVKREVEQGPDITLWNNEDEEEQAS